MVDLKSLPVDEPITLPPVEELQKRLRVRLRECDLLKDLIKVAQKNRRPARDDRRKSGQK